MRAARAQTHARRTLLTAAGVLALSPIAGTFLIDRCPMSIRFPEAHATLERWRSAAPAPEIVFLGSSRTGCAISAEEVRRALAKELGEAPPVFNAALPYGDPITMRYLSERLFASGPLPKIAVLEISPESTSRRHPFLDVLITRQFTIGDIIATGGDVFHSTDKAVSRLISSRVTPFYRHRLEFQAWIGQAVSRFRKDASEPPGRGQIPPPAPTVPAERPTELPDAAMPAEVRAMGGRERIRKRLSDYEISGLQPEALEALVAACRVKQMQVVLMQTPIHSSVRTLLRAEIMAEYRAFIQRLEATHGCRFVDVSARILDRLFKDPLHASREGRTEFSRMIAGEALGPLLRQEFQAREAAGE